MMKMRNKRNKKSNNKKSLSLKKTRKQTLMIKSPKKMTSTNPPKSKDTRWA
jgi:hypothetical protein